MTARRDLKETVHHPDGVTIITSEHRTEMAVSAADPAGAVAKGWDRRTLRRPGLDIECVATAELKGGRTEFTLHLTLDVSLNGAPYTKEAWTRVIPRRLL